MVGAYILIQTKVGKGSDVTNEVGQIEGITSAEAVTGPYDVIAYAQARNLDTLSRAIVGQIQEVDGVSRTLTCPVVHF
jgi:DNA-binding Lrp family transcriptional regulator